MSDPLGNSLEIPSIFSDHMVLQRGISVPVWGWTQPNATIEVHFSGQIKTTCAGKDGKWLLHLDPLVVSSESAELEIITGSGHITVKDVVVGEVWLASGQSNMECGLGDILEIPRPAYYAPVVEYLRNEIKHAEDALLRQFRVEESIAFAGPQETCSGEWLTSCPQENATFSATAYFFARELRHKLDVPVGIILSASGGSMIEPWVPEDVFAEKEVTSNYYNERVLAMRDDPDGSKEQARYQEALKQWEPDGALPDKPRVYSYPNLPDRQPTTYFNAMIAPLAPFAIRGTIWYQGEANRQHYPARYSMYLKGLIKDWRKLWGQGDFPFFFAQLPNFLSPPQSPAPPGQPSGADGWVTVCDQQRLTLAVANTGMAVLNDVGEAEDIHPANKVDAGRRLSLLALAMAYDTDMPAHTGPLYECYKIGDGKVIVSFDQVGSGLMVGEKHLMEPAVPSKSLLAGFEVAASDDKWKSADAKIVAGDRIEIWAASVPNPVAVRYAWRANPEWANLYNKEGLPASLFISGS